ncbi:MAG: glycosyltransferase family 39 protein [Candidatus Bathyarchaeia archaeon]
MSRARSCALAVVVLTLSITMHTQIPVGEFWFIVKVAIGLFGLIFLPGFVLTKIALDEKNVSITCSFIVGFMFQLLNVYVLWVIHIFYAPLNFVLLMCILTIIEVVFAMILSYKRESVFHISKALIKPKLDIALVTVIALYLILAFYWQQYASSSHSDGAAYMDMARNTVEKGDFYSNMLLPKNTWSYVEYSSGMHTHMFGYFAIALFFMLGNVSLFSAKIMLIFTGLLIILVVYELVKKLFNANVARLAALITAISPELLTHVGLVGGPEIPSALFTVFAIYLLVNAPTSKRKLSMAFMAGLSLFIAWYAWYLNFFVFVTFLPILFMYVSMKNREFSVSDVLAFLILLSSFILEWRVLLNFFYANLGVQIPSLIVVVFVLTYLLKFRKEKAKSTLVTFAFMLIVLYSAFYSRVIFADFIPQLQQFVASTSPGMGIVISNVGRDVSVFSRAFILEQVNSYWGMYWDGVYSYLDTVVVFLGFSALARIDKIRETALIISFPLLQAVWWGLFVTLDGGFQPRFIICSSLFYFILVASAIEMFYLYGIKTLEMTNTLNVNLKVKLWKASSYINKKNLVAAFVVGFLLASIFNFTYPLYDKHKKIMEGWNYPEIFGWEPAIQWIKNNTQPDDILMARQGNYWAWYTNRRTVFLAYAYFGSINITQLTSLIKEFKVKYLIVDYRSYSELPGLRLLYSSPSPFYGSQIVFQSINEQGYKTIVYNVTNISYGNLVRNEIVVTNCDSNQNWSTTALYGNGTITTDDTDRVEGNSSLKITFTVKEQKDLTPSAVVMYSLTQPLDLSNTSFLQFWTKTTFNYQDIHIKLATDPNNYIFLSTQKTQSQTWEQITIPLTNIISTLGEPNLKSINFIQIYIRSLEPNTTYTFWLDNISAYNEQYVINQQK